MSGTLWTTGNWNHGEQDGGWGSTTVFKNPEEKNYQSRILYRAKLSLRNENGIKAFPDKQKLT